jgi:DNA-binding LacI/PurR family transcriptional regulator
MDPFNHAIAVVKSRLESGAWQTGERMPSIAGLAAMCAVSRTTMWKALKKLQAESMLHAKQRGAIIAGPPGIARLPYTQTGTVWERVKLHIARDLDDGAFPQGNLPFVNKLALRYDVSSITVRKALHQLAREGVLESGGHRYAVARNRGHRRMGKIAVISVGDSEISLPAGDFRTRQVVEGFELLSMEQGYESRFAGFNDRDTESLLSVQRTLKKYENIEGFVVNLWNPWDEALRNRWFDLVHHLVSRKLPVVILDQSGNFILPDYLCTNPFIRMFRIAGVGAGESVAQAILRYGHRHIAFVTPYAAHHWVQDRYGGLCRHVGQYGPPGSTVNLCGLDEIKDLSELVLELLDLDKDDIVPLFGRRFAQPAIEDMYKTLDRIKRKKLLPNLDHDLKALTIRSDARHLCELAGKRHDAEMFGSLYESMYDWASTYALEIYLRPFFSGILKKKEITAWVCADDKTGLPALSFLSSAGKKVPGEIAVVGFDNWPHDFLQGLSSYDFNMYGMVRQAIRTISDKKEFRSRPAISTVEGFFVERRSIQSKRAG